MFVTDNMSKFARSSKNCEKLEKSQFLLKLIKSSVTGGTSQRVDFNGKAVRAHFGQSNFSFFQQKRKKEILLRSVHISANLIFHFSNKNGKRKYYLSLSVRAHFGQSNFPFFQQKRKKEILLILIIFTYFKVQTKIEKKKMVRKIDHFFIFLIFELPPPLFPYQFSCLLPPPPPSYPF